MPIELQYFDFGLSVIGFIITLWTLGTSLSVKKQLQQKFEQTSFQSSQQDILFQIEGFINSINEDHIYKTDNDKTFRPALSQFLMDIETRFTFLSRTTKNKIKSIRKKLHDPNPTTDTWTSIASDLIALKNYLNKELI